MNQKWKGRINLFIVGYTLALLLSSFVTMALTFLKAYSHKSKTVLVNIDSVGEANLELFFLVFLGAAFLVYSTVLLVKTYNKRSYNPHNRFTTP